MCIGNAIKQRSKVNQKFLNKSHILSDKHWEFIKVVVSKHLEVLLTLRKIFELLKAKYGEWNGVSANIGKFIESKVKISFKRISLIEQKTTTASNFRKSLRIAWIIKTLLDIDWECAFLMNFLFQADIILSKDEAWEESKLLVNKKTDNKSFSVMIALSQFRFLGMMVTDKTVRVSEIIKYLSSQ